jgi:DNA-binding CsgD family transcriptional regulator
MLARHRMMRGRPVEDVVPLVELAVADWRVVEELAREELWLVHAAVILVTADRLDAARALLARLLETARRRGVVRLFTLASTFGSFVALYSGDVPAAEADARTVLAVEGIERWRRAEAHAPLVEALVELGRADEAEAALESAGMAGPLPEARAFTPLLLARGRLRVAAGRHEEGLDDLKRAERRLDRSGRLRPAGLDGRASAVLALLALGRRDEARAAAREALERSHRWGTPRVVGRAQRMEAFAEGGPETVPRLEAAVAELERSPARLELAAALVDLGAAKRRANRRADARAPLKRALALADECGAVRIAEAARAELAATGIRVRRRDRSGRDALTPSERRICAMAAEGRSNPEIAQALFGTVKTVEMHLGHAYRKLDIRARGELAAVLRDAPA